MAAECLRCTVQREGVASRSVLLALAVVLAIQWRHPERAWLVGIVAGRLLVLAYQHRVSAQVQRLGAAEALRLGLENRLVAALAAGGVAWGLLTTLIERTGRWALRDELSVLLLVVASALMLITTSYLWRGMVGFVGRALGHRCCW